MNKTQRLTIALILVVAGCDESPVAVPQTSSEATEQTELPVEPLTTTMPPEVTTEASEITGKVVHISDGDTIDILIADKTKIRRTCRTQSLD